MKKCLKCAEVFSSQSWVCPACGYEPLRLNSIELHAEEFANGGGGFKPEYFAELAKLESTNFWFRVRNKLIVWALRKFKPFAQNFLEVGCGTGFVLSGIAESNPDMSLTGSEIFLEGLSHATARLPSATFMQMDARYVPFADEFDVIGAFDVLEHIEEDDTVLAQLHNALKPNGVLLLTVPQHPQLWSTSDEYACHVRRYTCAEIEAKVLKAGYRLLKSTSFVTLLLPAMMLSRLKHVNDDNYDPAGELKISPFLNKVFYALMILEIKGIRLGLNYPVGGSRLIVARKVSQ
jgi:SAM-dependent methyltransferase